MDSFEERALPKPEASRDLDAWLEARLGGHHAHMRLAREFRVENAMRQQTLHGRQSLRRRLKSALPFVLRATRMLDCGRRNATQIQVLENQVTLAGLPAVFDGFTILHLSDLHADISEAAMGALPAALNNLSYDICVMTGDYRGRVWGPCQRAVDLIGTIVSRIVVPVYAVLGNHDPAAMLPALEAMGVRMLMNEAAAIDRERDSIWIAGLDDPYFYRTDDLGQAMATVPAGATSILLSHSTDGYEQAAAAGTDLMLSGHTHGGQVCLPGGIPLLTNSNTPRRMAAGPWRHGRMPGYTSRGVGTSVIDVRFNCAPEVTLHRLRAG